MLRKDYQKKSGQYSVCLRITYGRFPKLFPLNFDCLEEDFKTGKQRVKKTDPYNDHKNKLILKEETEVRDLAFDYTLNDKNLPIAGFTRA